MKYSKLIIVFVFASYSCKQVTIRNGGYGNVYDSETREPINNVQISSKFTNEILSYTNEKGFFVIPVQKSNKFNIPGIEPIREFRDLDSLIIDKKGYSKVIIGNYLKKDNYYFFDTIFLKKDKLSN
jgi:hypothetical protein